MKFIYLFLTFLFSISVNNISVSPVTNGDDNKGDIAVHVKNVQVKQGVVYVGLFENKKTFRKIDKVYKVEVLKANSNEGVVVIEDVPFDEYAIVIFQDLNGNQKFDKNFIGTPKEPFGFSTNFKVSTRAPNYDEVTFKHNEEDTELKVELQTF